MDLDAWHKKAVRYKHMKGGLQNCPLRLLHKGKALVAGHLEHAYHHLPTAELPIITHYPILALLVKHAVLLLKGCRSAFAANTAGG